MGTVSNRADLGATPSGEVTVKVRYDGGLRAVSRPGAPAQALLTYDELPGGESEPVLVFGPGPMSSTVEMVVVYWLRALVAPDGGVADG